MGIRPLPQKPSAPPEDLQSSLQSVLNQRNLSTEKPFDHRTLPSLREIDRKPLLSIIDMIGVDLQLFAEYFAIGFIGL